MHILVDGHNLIPYLPGLDLKQIDDEEKLISLLQAYALQTRHIIEVFFDGAPPGKAGVRPYGSVTARFVSAKMIADHAIRGRLEGMGAEARQVTVVSSDRQVQSEARSRGARTLTSDAFAREMLSLQEKPPAKPRQQRVEPPKAKIEPPLPPDQVQDWLDMFKGGKGK
jgi:uncharacterized protein